MSIKEIFAAASRTGQQRVYSRIDESHPADIFVGVEGGRPALMAICKMRPPDPPLLAALRIDVRARQSGDWALVISLERPELDGLFHRLLEDLVIATATNTDPGRVIIDRLHHWKRLFSGKPATLLGEDELRGLAGEIRFLLDLAAPSVGPRASVTAWRGPFGTPKDFMFAAVEVEVKATTRQPRSVRISSLEQLSDAGLPLFLWCIAVDIEPLVSDPSRTVAALIALARQSFAVDAVAADRLETVLLAAGYEDRPEYSSIALRFGPSTCFRVEGAFPRIQRQEVKNSVLRCTYDIDASALGEFAVSHPQEVLFRGP